MDLMFRSKDGPYLRLPNTFLSSDISEAFVKTLDANLKKVRSKSRLYEEKLAAERVATTPLDEQNVPSKVIRHTKNNVEC